MGVRMAPVAPGFPDRHALGRLGEDLACQFLVRRGLTVVGRNVEVAGGEIDLVVRHGRTTVAVKVRSRWMDDPVDAFHHDKHRQVSVLARTLDAARSVGGGGYHIITKYTQSVTTAVVTLWILERADATRALVSRSLTSASDALTAM